MLILIFLGLGICVGVCGVAAYWGCCVELTPFFLVFILMGIILLFVSGLVYYNEGDRNEFTITIQYRDK